MFDSQHRFGSKDLLLSCDSHYYKGERDGEAMRLQREGTAHGGAVINLWDVECVCIGETHISNMIVRLHRLKADEELQAWLQSPLTPLNCCLTLMKSGPVDVLKAVKNV